MPALLRPATPEDAGDIARVLRASRLRFLSYAPPAHSETEDLRWVSHNLIPSGGVTIASVEQVIVGVVAVSHIDGAGWIDQMYVAPGYCGRGIGTQLLSAALGSLKMPVRLHTFEQNKHARRFYERYGFKPVIFGDGSENEEGCPDVLYELGADDA